MSSSTEIGTSPDSASPTSSSPTSSISTTPSETIRGNSATGFSPFPSTFTQSSRPSETSSGNDGNNGNNGGNNQLQSSASLYLYTFLATLVLLLGVSAAIVIRSLLLRRRHRRMIEEAIANGTWIPPTSGRGVKVDISKKPVMHEAFLGGGYVKGKDDMDWDGILPFSANYVNPPATPQDSNDTENTPSSDEQATRRRTLTNRINKLFHKGNNAPPSSSVPMTPLPPSTPLPPQPVTMNVAVLIAMPSQTPFRTTTADEEDNLPHIEVGVSKMQVQVPPAEVHRKSDESHEAGT